MLDKNKSILSNTIVLLKVYKKKIILSLFLTMILTIVNAYMPVLTQSLLDKGISCLDKEVTVRIVLIMLALALFKQLIDAFQNIIHIDMKNELELELQHKAMHKLLRMKIAYFNEEGFFKILNGVTFNITHIAQLADKSFLALVMEIMKVVGGLVGLFIINKELTMFLLLLIPIKYGFIRILTKHKEKLFSCLLSMMEKLGQWHGEVINGIYEIKLWNLYNQQEGQYNSLLKDKMALDKKIQILDQINNGSDSFLQSMIFNLLYIVGLNFIISEELTFGGLIAFISYSSIIIQPITLFLTMRYQFAYVTPALKGYIEFMEQEGEISKISCKVVKNKVPDVIQFKNVDLSYGTKKVLQDVSVKFYKGEKIAFVGSNGSGKTSLINLLLRLYTPTHGAILMDHVNIDEIDLETYRDLFAVMNQQVYLFNTSIKNNLVMFSEETQEQIRQRCKDNHIEDFIQFAFNDSQKLEKVVGVKGNGLSGGERQKVSFVRTLLKPNSSILILDEATSNYDAGSEQIFNNLIASHLKYNYLFLITHRLEVLEKMDKIVVMDKGHVIWCGTYEGLIHENKVLSIIQNQESKEEEISYGESIQSL